MCQLKLILRKGLLPLIGKTATLEEHNREGTEQEKANFSPFNPFSFYGVSYCLNQTRI